MEWAQTKGPYKTQPISRVRWQNPINNALNPKKPSVSIRSIVSYVHLAFDFTVVLAFRCCTAAADRTFRRRVYFLFVDR